MVLFPSVKILWLQFDYFHQTLRSFSPEFHCQTTSFSSQLPTCQIPASLFQLSVPKILSIFIGHTEEEVEFKLFNTPILFALNHFNSCVCIKYRYIPAAHTKPQGLYHSHFMMQQGFLNAELRKKASR